MKEEEEEEAEDGRSGRATAKSSGVAIARVLLRSASSASPLPF